MTAQLKASVLFQILSLAPMGESETRFKKLAADADVDGFWNYYQGCMRAMPDMDARIEKQGKVSFRMLRPAMEAVYRTAPST